MANFKLNALRVIISLVFLTKVSEALLCLKCGSEDTTVGSVVNLDQCTQFVECGSDEVCYVERYLTDDGVGLPLYRAGCRSTHLCKLIACDKVEYAYTTTPQKGKRDLPICTECCYNDTCNINGCGSSLINPNSLSTMCFVCDKLPDDKTNCDRITTCGSNEKCSYQYKPTRYPAHYEYGCLANKTCAVLERAGQLSSACCDGNLCNVNKDAERSENSSIADDLPCPSGIVKTPRTEPTSKQQVTSETTKETSIKVTLTPTHAVTSAMTTPTPPTTTAVTAAPVTTSTKPLPHTIPPIATTCAVCSGPLRICEKVYHEQSCAPPNNYCINHIVNNQFGQRQVNRTCGSFDTCFSEWFQGSSDSDKCQNFDEKFVLTLDFECTFCCVNDRCNIPLRPNENTLYKDV